MRWVEAGLLRGTQTTEGAPWRIQVTDEDRRRLTTTNAPEDWVPLKAAATALGVSQQTVVQRLKSGKLDAVRVRLGRRSGWRIRVPQGVYNQQPDLFQQSSL